MMHSHHAHAHGSPGMGFGMALLVALCLGSVLLYLIAQARARDRGKGWSGRRTASFVIGMALIVCSLLPPLATRAHQDLSAHMYQHLLLGMFGPIAVVLGTPVTLALRALPTSVSRRLVALLHGGPVRWISHPVSALVLNVGGMGVLYMSPLYALMAVHGTLHTLVHFHFLAAGCLFAWSILQLEPAGPHRLSAQARLAILFVAIAAHATIAKAMYAYGFPRGTVHSGEELQRAAKIMYYGGDLSELLLMVVLFMGWPRAASASEPGGVLAAERVRVPLDSN